MLGEKEEIFLPSIDRRITSSKMGENAKMGKRLNVHHGHRIELQGMVASALLVLALLGAQAAEAQTFENASAAYRRGDYAVAFESFRDLAAQGHADAQALVGHMYAEGRGVPQDDTEAVRWYRQAAEQGNAHAQYYLGIMYAGGRGVPQDYVQAHKWINLAAARSSASDQWREDAVQTRDDVASTMTTVQIAEAQRLAREWEPKQASAQSPLGDAP